MVRHDKSYLNEYSHGKYIVLVAHNGHVCDDEHLIRALNCTGLADDFKSTEFLKKYLGISHKESGLYAFIVGGHTAQTFNFCNSRPDVCQCLVV